MNDYDSNRIVDLLGEAMQLEKTDDLNEADVVVLNTCSIREKAQEKVFSDLGRIREAKRDRPDMMIAVGGCVASQEGAGIVKRAPWVDVVFGPQTMHRLRSKHHINPRCALHNASTFLTSYTSAHSNHHVRTIPFSLSNAA